MRGVTLRLELHLSPTTLRWALTGLLLVAGAAKLDSEEVTLVTYYPAPSGVYAKLVVTGNAYLARDGGRVGIGNSTPAYALDVTGSIRGDAVINPVYTP